MTERKITIPVITGPTASGKTQAALYLASKRNIEIISADSRQIYRFMDIGTAKPSRMELKSVKHHLIDICDPDEVFSAADFVRLSLQAIEEILARGKTPLITGGTGMYVWALENGLFDPGNIPPDVRSKIKAKVQKEGLSSVYHRLKEMDPEAASKIHSNDLQRITRAMEIIEATGKTLTWWHKNQTGPNHPYQFKQIVLMPERSFIYRIINERVMKMVEQGLIDEVVFLLEKGYTRKMNALKSVGYREVFPYLDGAYDLQEMIRLIQRNTRRFAKRQITWFKKYGGMHLPFSNREEYHHLLEELHQKLLP